MRLNADMVERAPKWRKPTHLIFLSNIWQAEQPFIFILLCHWGACAMQPPKMTTGHHRYDHIRVTMLPKQRNFHLSVTHTHTHKINFIVHMHEPVTSLIIMIMEMIIMMMIRIEISIQCVQSWNCEVLSRMYFFAVGTMIQFC